MNNADIKFEYAAACLVVVLVSVLVSSLSVIVYEITMMSMKL